MTRSPGRFPSRGRAALIALLVGGASLLATSPASAKKKKSAPAAAATDTEAPSETGDAKAGMPGEKTAPPAAQASDTEKPKVILDVNQEAPKTDSLGHVHFGSPNTEGIGRVAVKAGPEQKIKVFLEGRYFGTAPLTIYSVPKGDYILEATYPSGKQVSKPVTVGENEETAIDLNAAQASNAGEGGSSFLNAEMTPSRLHWAEAFLAVAAVGVVGAVTFGILELKDESDYSSTPITDTAKRDDITNRGNRDALLTNIGLGVAAVGVIGAAITGYPLVFKSSGEKKTALVLTPTAGRSGAGGLLTLRF